MAQHYITNPTSFRLANLAQQSYDLPFTDFQKAMPHESHPSVDRLIVLVFSAVLQVICVSLPGYFIARLGHFDADKQKFLANLNVMLFTPCLIFTKLASQLNAGKLADLAVIPVIFTVQTLVSWTVSILVSRLFGFNRRASNFVTAMGVFGNSNSLPISLVLSLSQTLKGLHWDRIPGDNDDEVSARGILYLLIFQQLGQLVRWSWGYHVLLAPKYKYLEYRNQQVEEGRYTDEQVDVEDGDENDDDSDSDREDRVTAPLLNGYDGDTAANSRTASSSDLSHYQPGGRTPIASRSRASLVESDSEDGTFISRKASKSPAFARLNGKHAVSDDDENGMLSFPRIRNLDEAEVPEGIKGFSARAKVAMSKKLAAAKQSAASFITRIYGSLPQPIQALLSEVNRFAFKTCRFLYEFMNPPLWAMLIAVIVASVPALQKLFFQEGSFVKNSVTSAIQSSGNVAVPLILVVLGANLARNTQKSDKNRDPEEDQIGRKLLTASLLCRMVLPTLIMAPILAVFAKYVPVSILDDPIFIIVCFLLTGAPSALQLAQICQINEVYEGVMSNILFQSYVIWILPSTLVLVMCALEVVEWAQMG